MARILVVDDTAFMRLSIKKIIEKGGHELVGEASNGIEAIKTYEKVQPDLVTMDITMPEMNGIDATKGIIDINPNAKIIICSAMGQEPMVKESIVAGAKHFIVKPLNEDDVLSIIESVLNL